MTSLRWMPLLLAMGCRGCFDVAHPTQDVRAPDVAADDPPEAPSCEGAALSQSFPTDGATDVFPDATWRIGFSLPERDTAAFTLRRDDDGTEIPLEAVRWSGDGQTAILSFARLAPSTDHTLTVTYGATCAEDDPLHGFLRIRTSDVGAPVSAETLVDRAWVLDLTTMEVLEPLGVGSLVGAMLGEVRDAFAVSVTGWDAETSRLSLRGALLDPGPPRAQRTCAPTWEGGDALVWTDPFFSLELPASWEIRLPLLEAEAHLTLEGGHVSGAFSPDGTRLEGLALSTTVDLRSLEPLLGEDALGEGDVCMLVWQLTHGAVSCSECADGTTACLPVAGEHGVAHEEPLGLEPITEAQALDCLSDTGAP